MARPAQRSAIPTGLYFVLPVVTVFLAVRVLPSLGAFYLSFTDFGGIDVPRWIGLANYRELVGDPVFRDALRNTVIYSVGVVIPSTLIGLGIALLLELRPSCFAASFAPCSISRSWCRSSPLR